MATEGCVEVTVRIATDAAGVPTIGIGAAYLGAEGVCGTPDTPSIVRVLLMGLSAATDAGRGQLTPPPRVVRTTAAALRQMNGHRRA